MRYQFAEFEFDPERGLSRNGSPVDLEPRAQDLLRHLLENPGRVISRDELCEHLWDGRVISDAAISTQIRSVRKALDDDRERQRFVKTHPRRGFSFVGEIATDPLSSGADAPRPAQARRRGSAMVIASAFLVLAAAAVLWFGGVEPEDGLHKPRGPSIAVLPFENLSGDPTKDYLADAFNEELITDLSRIRDAFVISRSTSFTYRGKEVGAAELATDLGVRYVLEGSIRIDGEQVRVNAQLIDGKTDSHIWSERYDRDLSALFDLQGNVTGQISSVLRAELRKAESDRQDPNLSRDAWDYALRGNVLLYNHQSISDYQQAHDLLSQAVELDPEISSAWGGLAFVHLVANFATVPGITNPDSARLSLEAALKATQADPMNAEPYWLVGAGYVRTGRPELGMPACDTAMDLYPNMDCGYVCAGLVHLALDEPDKAIPFFQYALELNPRFRPFTKEKYLGLAYIQTGQDDLAVAALERALALVPNDTFANLAMTSALALGGRSDMARQILDQHFQSTGKPRPSLTALQSDLTWMGPRTTRMLDGLRKAGL